MQNLINQCRRLLMFRCDHRFGQRAVPVAFTTRLLSKSWIRPFLRFLFWVTHPIPAVNVGDHNSRFFAWGWQTLNVSQPADHLANVKRDPLPFDSDSIGYLYASHILEHLSDQEVTHFLSEAYRVLRPGGLIRIVVPDLEKYIRSYLNDGCSLHLDRPAGYGTCPSIRDELQKYNDSRLMEPHNAMVSVVASYTNDIAPIACEESEFEQHFSQDRIDDFIQWAINKKETANEDFGHFNGYTFERLAAFLRTAGFEHVSRGFYCDPFCGTRFKGLDLANKSHISLYVNAGKTVRK